MLNLFTAIIASIVIGFFQEDIEKVVALAVLMPIVASMGGNAGTQTLTVAVRAMATRELTSSNAIRLFGKEITINNKKWKQDLLAWSLLYRTEIVIAVASFILGAIIF